MRVLVENPVMAGRQNLEHIEVWLSRCLGLQILQRMIIPPFGCSPALRIPATMHPPVLYLQLPCVQSNFPKRETDRMPMQYLPKIARSLYRPR